MHDRCRWNRYGLSFKSDELDSSSAASGCIPLSRRANPSSRQTAWAWFLLDVQDEKGCLVLDRSLSWEDRTGLLPEGPE
jgi:hypothetical protein